MSCKWGYLRVWGFFLVNEALLWPFSDTGITNQVFLWRSLTLPDLLHPLKMCTFDIYLFTTICEVVWRQDMETDWSSSEDGMKEKKPKYWPNNILQLCFYFYSHIGELSILSWWFLKRSSFSFNLEPQWPSFNPPAHLTVFWTFGQLRNWCCTTKKKWQ